MADTNKKEKKVIYLSSSKIDTLETCSWIYYCKYILKLPDKTNDGAMRGTACHDLLEFLAKDKRQELVKKVGKSLNAIKSSKLVERFLFRKYNQLGLDPDKYVDKKVTKKTPTNHELVLQMLHTVLSMEFLSGGEKRNVIHSEYEFNIQNEKPKYAVRGFVDRISEIENEKGEKFLEILDYKSSKKKFEGDKATANLQGMIYTLAAKKKWNDYKRHVANFFFMRFPKDPYQKHEFTDEQISGLEHYLEYLTQELETFDYSSGLSNMAAHKQKDEWLCGRGSWVCPFKNPFDFYQVVDTGEDEKESEAIAGFYKYDEAEEYIKDKDKKRFKIEIRKYDGCPAWRNDLTL